MNPRQLQVGGVTPFTATDYPGQLAAVVFVQGCPWRCGYCHNPHLQERRSDDAISWPQTLALLQRRVGLIDAVVFSGGEPTIDPGLPAALAEVKRLGFLCGLHTACIYPRQLEQVLPLLDWVGFDIKAPFADYEKITGVAASGRTAHSCAELILASGVAHECRTTIHPDLHTEQQLLALADSLAQMGVNNYALQQFRARGNLNSKLNAADTVSYPSAAVLQNIASKFARFTLRRAG